MLFAAIIAALSTLPARSMLGNTIVRPDMAS